MMMRCDGLLRAAFAGYEDADALDHLSGGSGTLGQKYIGVNGTIEGGNGTGDDHRRQTGVELFCATDKLIAIHLRHDEVGKNQIKRTWDGLLDVLERLLCGCHSDHAIATSLKQEGTDGQDLFVVVYTEDRFLRAHEVSLLPDATLW
jgi:hypothetical protein